MTPTHVLEEEHERILVLLLVLDRLARQVREGERPFDRIAECLELLRTFADDAHHGKEERHLFPALEQVGLPRHAGPIGVMLREHDLGRAELSTMAAALDDLRRDEAGAAVRLSRAAASYTGLLRDHIDKENLVLFRMARELLAVGAAEALAAAYAGVDEEALGPGGYARALARIDRLEQEVLGPATV
ncbi:MAG: hemerythrin domain-containing protein [Planctomycetota bacterium]|nr:hemerythrin domain-containing protein [Planctomycetota bacterium]